MKKNWHILIILIGLTACNNNVSKPVSNELVSEPISNNSIDLVNSLDSVKELDNNVFSNAQFPVRFSFPEGWEVSEDSVISMLHIISPLEEEDDFQEMVNIVLGGSRNLGLDEFFDRNLEMVENMFEVLSQTEEPSYVTINDTKFKKVRYNYVLEGLPLTAQLFVAVKGENSYIINCSAFQNTFDKYQADFRKIVESIVID